MWALPTTTCGYTGLLRRQPDDIADAKLAADKQNACGEAKRLWQQSSALMQMTREHGWGDRGTDWQSWRMVAQMRMPLQDN